MLCLIRIAGITPEVLRQASVERKPGMDWRSAAAAATAANSNGNCEPSPKDNTREGKSNNQESGGSTTSTEDGNEKAEKIILAIEKFSVFVFLFSFLMFNVYYWVDLFSANKS